MLSDLGKRLTDQGEINLRRGNEYLFVSMIYDLKGV